MKEILRITFPVGSRLPMICHEEMEYQDWKIPAHVSKKKSKSNQVASNTFSTYKNPNNEGFLDRHLSQPPQPPLRPRSLPRAPQIPSRALARRSAPHRRKAVQRRIWKRRQRMPWKRVRHAAHPAHPLHASPAILLPGRRHDVGTRRSRQPRVDFDGSGVPE